MEYMYMDTETIFAKKLEQILDLKNIMKDMQSEIGCKVVDDILFYETKSFLQFAKQKGLSLELRKSDNPIHELVSWGAYCEYKDTHLCTHFSDIEYHLYQEEGLLP